MRSSILTSIKSARARARAWWREHGPIPPSSSVCWRMAPPPLLNSATPANIAPTSAWSKTPKVHNLIVCTLCSCYPWPLLGLPPMWYKSAPYRSRAVIDPRGVLREFGNELAEEVEVRVWDSTAEERYLVLPERPAGTEEMKEDALAALVTRDSMIGVAKVVLPAGDKP